MKLDLFIELNGNQVDSKAIQEKVKEQWKSLGNKVKDLETLKLYYKPDEKNCYYIINEDVKGKVSV